MRVDDGADVRALAVRRPGASASRTTACGPGAPRHSVPSRSVITIISADMKPFETLAGVISSRSGPMRTLMLPSFDATKPRVHSRRPTSTMSSRSAISHGRQRLVRPLMVVAAFRVEQKYLRVVAAARLRWRSALGM